LGKIKIFIPQNQNLHHEKIKIGNQNLHREKSKSSSSSTKTSEHLRLLWAKEWYEKKIVRSKFFKFLTKKDRF